MRDPFGRLAATAALLVCLGASPAGAARPALRQYSTHEGVPQKQVTAILQDHTGYLWVGTLAGGLARYDGHQWTVFDASNGLPGGAVVSLAEDAEGRVFVGTSGGAAVYANGGWTPIPAADDPLQRQMDVVQPIGIGRCWLGTPFGLLLWTGQGKPTNPFRGQPGGNDAVITLARGRRGDLWVGTREGLYHVSGDPAVRQAVSGVPKGRIWAVLERADGSLVVSVGEVGAFEQKGDRWTRVGDDQAPGRRVNTLAVEQGGALWLGTDDRGAYRWAGGRLEPFGLDQGLPNKSVSSIIEDREGLLWFGTDEGLTKRGPSAFVTYDESDGFPTTAVFGMAEDKDGSLWFTLDNAGVAHRTREGKLRRFTTADGLPDNRAYDVVADPTGGIWASTRSGLARIVGDRVSRPPMEGTPPRGTGSLAVLPDGALLMAGTDGLAVLRGGKVERVPALEGHTVSTIFVGKDGLVWCGGVGWGAMALRDLKPVTRLGKAEGLPSDQVTFVFVDSRGTLWVCTENGAWRRDPSGAVQVYGRASGLPDPYVYWAGEDPQGAIWLGTNRGAVRLPPGGGAPGVFTSRDGLGDDECNDDGFFVDSRGTVYVTSLGISEYRGGTAARPAASPLAVVEQMLVNARPHPGGPLPPGPGPITFRFAGLSFVDEHAVRFRYRLLGLSPAWAETSPDQWETTYGGLGPGEYRFEVLALAPDGRVSSEPAALSFIVRPHWWETRTAWALAALAVLGLVRLVVRVREQRLLAASARLERQVAERTEELRQANQRLAELAITDELTGLANRRHALEGLGNAIALARRQGTPLSLALADMDHFKDVNDTLGHAAGDRLLVGAAAAMLAELRNIDLLGRYGGEEFLVVLPGSDLAGAREACERLRRAIEQLDGQAGGLRPTVSIGVATLDGPNVDASELVRRADEALYRAKAAGRNRVVCHGQDA